MDSVLTSMIVLRKQPYQENGLLLTGISPDCGKLSLLLRGAQNFTAKKPLVVDLFRELEVNFLNSGKSELFLADKVELLTSFDALGDDPKSYKFASRVGSFLLKNSSINLPMPYTYDVWRNILIQLLLPVDTPGKWSLEESSVVIKMTYLYENGLLPEISDAKESEFMESLVASGIEGTLLPEGHNDYYHRLNLWLDELLSYHNLAK